MDSDNLLKSLEKRDKVLKTLGAKIRRARLDKGLTQQKVASIIPMKAGAYLDIEKGYVACRITTLQRIAETLEMDIKDFL